MNANGSQARWPKADVIVGNPPFIGNKKMRGELGDAYVDVVRLAYRDNSLDGADLVCFWFEKARMQMEAGQLQSAGWVSTNSIRGGKNREVLSRIFEKSRIIETLQELRLGFLRGLSTWSTFGKGWARRVEEVRRDALAMTVAPAEPLTPVTDYEVVRLGSQGPWVERLQAYLGAAVTGTLDATTEGALKAWQARNGLEPDGVAGRLTYRAKGLIP